MNQIQDIFKTIIYCKGRDTEGKREIFYSLVHSPQQACARLNQKPGASSSPTGVQGPSHFACPLPSQEHQQEAELEVEQTGLKPACKWDASPL